MLYRARGSDRSGDSAGNPHEGGTGAVRMPQHEPIGEHRCQPCEGFGTGTAECAGADVGIPEREHGDSPHARSFQERHRTPAELLRIIDHEEARHRGDTTEQQRLGGFTEHLGGVAMGWAQPVEHVSVLTPERASR